MNSDPAVNQAHIIPIEYDYHSPLTRTEKKALADLRAIYEQPCRTVGFADIAQERLPRFVKPIRDAIEYSQYAADRHSPIIYLILKYMMDFDLSFGQISEVQWVAILQDKDYGHLTFPVYQRVSACLPITLYLLGCFSHYHRLLKTHSTQAFRVIFGEQALESALDRIVTALTELGYQSHQHDVLRPVLANILLVHRSSRLEVIQPHILQDMRQTAARQDESRFIFRIAYGLFGLGILKQPLEKFISGHEKDTAQDEWKDWCYRWEQHSTIRSRRNLLNNLLQVGHWLRSAHPDLKTPLDWDRQTCLEYVAEFSQLKHGDWNAKARDEQRGQLLHPRTRRKKIDAVRTFFKDLQEWEWIPRRFNPHHALSAPAYIHAQIGPEPRVIESRIWAKLVQAALNITADDIQPLASSQASQPSYPLTMVQAIALIWIFGGLRNDEIRRLRVGCIRETQLHSELTSEHVVMPIRIPPNKTSGAFEKSVSLFAAEAIQRWERERPTSPTLLDKKTGELVHFLFVYRGRCIGSSYINKHLIPMLCRKAQIEQEDAKGRITSHRARSTVSEQLISGEHPLTLTQLKAWLGHTHVESTLHYIKPTPTRVANAYQNTDYFERNLRWIDVLVDQENIRQNAPEGWIHYDLGHGYCSNDFFAKCEHRMACARCSFYIPKESSQAQILEAKQNLRRMMHEIELSDLEVAVIEGDIEAFDRLLEQLRAITTPDNES